MKHLFYAVKLFTAVAISSICVNLIMSCGETTNDRFKDTERYIQNYQEK
jgi:hypothetical protein